MAVAAAAAVQVAHVAWHSSSRSGSGRCCAECGAVASAAAFQRQSISGGHCERCTALAAAAVEQLCTLRMVLPTSNSSNLWAFGARVLWALCETLPAPAGWWLGSFVCASVCVCRPAGGMLAGRRNHIAAATAAATAALLLPHACMCVCCSSQPFPPCDHALQFSCMPQHGLRLCVVCNSSKLAEHFNMYMYHV